MSYRKVIIDLMQCLSISLLIEEVIEDAMEVPGLSPTQSIKLLLFFCFNLLL